MFYEEGNDAALSEALRVKAFTYTLSNEVLS